MKAKNYIEAIVLLLLGAAVIINSVDSKAGATSGVMLCRDIIIPSLLPILIISTAMTLSSCRIIFEKIFGKIIASAFHLPKTAAAPIIFGAICGYPSGAILTNQLYKNGLIDQEDANRIMRFNINPGVAFCITAVGSVYLKNQRSGAVIYLICTASSIIIGIIQGLFNKNKKYYYSPNKSHQDLQKAMISSIEASTKSILIMSVYIVFFSAIIKSFKLPAVVIPLFEIAGGIFKSATPIPLEYLCFFISFSGFCIHFQIFGIIKEFNMKYLDLFLSRLISSIISYFLGKAYTIFFPNEAEVFSNISQAIPQANSLNSKLSIVLLLSCIVIVLDVNNKKSKLI